MKITDEQIRKQIQLGEDSQWEFKQVVFKGDTPNSPRREDLADEIGAFANADGGMLVCGVSDDRQIQGMTRPQIEKLDRMLVEVCTDTIKPSVRPNIYRRMLDSKAFLLVEVPKGYDVHKRSEKAFIRVGSTKRQLGGNEELRLRLARAQSRYSWFDKQIVEQTGFNSLSESIWEMHLSVTGAIDPQKGLKNLNLLTEDDSGVIRSTVAGVLLCAKSPQKWLPQSKIMATLYRGKNRASNQLDFKEIVGPLYQQIAEAVKFVARNMRVAARKIPQREEYPQYSLTAVFEGVVNAVVHRDYSMSSRNIRLSIFSDRLEIDSPGRLPNGMTIEGMEESQSTRNEVIASVLGKTPVDDTLGSDHRYYIMERRGDGVSLIKTKTQETAGVLPKYEIVDESNVILTIPAANLEFSQADATVKVHSAGELLPSIEVLAMYPNKTWKQSTTNYEGEAVFDLYTTNLPMTVYFAAKGFSAGIKENWLPNEGSFSIELRPIGAGGSVFFTRNSGQIPGLRGRINPKRDAFNRTYLYADNISIEEGRQQPVPFRLGKAMYLVDANGAEFMVTIVDIIGQLTLLEYRQL